MKTNIDCNTITVWLSGRIDNENYKEIQEELIELCKKHSEKKLILDVENLRYLSSIGVRMLIILRKMNKDMEIVQITKELHHIFCIVGLDKIIRLKMNNQEP